MYYLLLFTLDTPPFGNRYFGHIFMLSKRLDLRHIQFRQFTSGLRVLWVATDTYMARDDEEARGWIIHQALTERGNTTIFPRWKHAYLMQFPASAQDGILARKGPFALPCLSALPQRLPAKQYQWWSWWKQIASDHGGETLATSFLYSSFF